jgi:hypothetical protein
MLTWRSSFSIKGVSVDTGNVLEFAATSTVKDGEDMVKLLINRGIDIGSHGNGALRVAMTYHNDRLVKLLGRFVKEM